MQTIEMIRNCIQLLLPVARKTNALRYLFPNQAFDVLTTPELLRTIRITKVHLHPFLIVNFSSWAISLFRHYVRLRRMMENAA